MKNKIKANFNANTLTDMFKIQAKSGEICNVCGEYYKFDGKTWNSFKGK